MSSPETKPLRHILYTCALGEGRRQGYRPILDYFDGEKEEGTSIINWLLSLEASTDEGCGWATQVFPVNGLRHAALAIIDPHFGSDDVGSMAMLAHALLVPVPEDHPQGHFFFALYEAAKRFLPEIGQIGSLQSYREGCKTIRDITIPEFDPVDLRKISSEFLREFLVTAAHLQTGASVPEVSFPGVWAEEELPEMLARAGGVLPPSIRLAFPWATGVEPASGLVVVHRRPVGDAPLAIQGNLGEVYFDWLQEKLDQREFDTIRQFAEDSSINSWDKLRERILSPPAPNFETEHDALKESELPVQEPVTRDSDAPTAPIPQEEGTTMKGKGRPKLTDPSSRASMDELRGLVHEEFDRIWDTTEKYLNERLNRMGAPSVTLSESGGGRAKRSRASRWFQAFRPEIYLLLVLSLIGWIYWIGRQPNAPPRPGPNPVPTPQPTPLTTDVPNSAPTSSEDFVAQWHEYLRTYPKKAALWLVVVANLPSPARVGPQTRKSLVTWAKELESGQALSGEEAAKAATALFEYFHADWAARENKENQKDNVVSLSTDEVTPEHLNAILQELNLNFGPNPSRDDPNVQAAIVLKSIGSSQ